MDIWNKEGEEASSRLSGPDEPTSQLPVHLVLPGTEPNMQSERLRVGMPLNAVPGGGPDAAAAEAAAAAAAAAAGGGGDDMFADDDMFGEGGGGGGVKRNPVVPAGLVDNYDDPEGYYNFQVGADLFFAPLGFCIVFGWSTTLGRCLTLAMRPLCAYGILHGVNCWCEIRLHTRSFTAITAWT
jgi:hypothetical protein